MKKKLCKYNVYENTLFHYCIYQLFAAIFDSLFRMKVAFEVGIDYKEI